MFCSSFPLTNSLYLAAVGVNTTLLSLSVSYTPSTNPFCKKKKKKRNMQLCRGNGRQVILDYLRFLFARRTSYKISRQIRAININVRSLTLLFAKKKKEKIRVHARNISSAHTTTDRMHLSYGQLSKTRRKFRISSSREANALHYRRKTMTSKILRNYLHGRYVGKETQE